MLKQFVFVSILLGLALSVSAQSQMQDVLENQLRLNLVSPGLEFEYRLGSACTVLANGGIGYGGSFKNLSYNNNNGFQYLISPFVDLQGKYYYNLDKRIRKGRKTAFNSGNFVSLRFLARGNSIQSNFDRTSDWDFSFGPTWGIQRSFGRVHYLFDVGPYYYFDGKGNNGFFPVMVQFNVGYNLLH